MNTHLNVLALLPDTRLPDNSRLYSELATHLNLTVIRMTRSDRRDLRGLLAGQDLHGYDRIILELRFKHALPQIKYLQSLPNLVLIEDDTWQNYVCFGKNQGKFTSYYEALRPRRIINSGHAVAMALRAQGYDAVFLGKGFDGTRLRNLDQPRDIEMAFVGRVEHANYLPRQKLLQALHAQTGLPLIRTSTVEEYTQTLNRIRFFISADVHFGEHMIKNFEAMACGCVLVAFSQGLDDTHLGMRDGYNCMLYKNISELEHKIQILRQDADRAAGIARRGQQLAEEGHEYAVLAHKYAELLAPDFR